MSKKIILLILLTSAIFISGCLDKDTTTSQTLNSEFIPRENLPEGFSFLAIHDALIEIGDSKEPAIEGIYRYNGEDIYIQVIKSNDTASLVQRSKEKFKDVKYDPFQEVIINSHKATQIKDYVTVPSGQIPSYTILWAAEENLIIVGPSPDTKTVISLATATGN